MGDSLNSPLVPGLFGALEMGESTAPISSSKSKDTDPGNFPHHGLPTMWKSQVPCSSGWFSQTIHLGRESKEILQPRGLRRALESELSRNQQSSWGNASPCMDALYLCMIQWGWLAWRAPQPSILLCPGSWLFLTAPSHQGLLCDPYFKSSIPGKPKA